MFNSFRPIDLHAMDVEIKMYPKRLICLGISFKNGQIRFCECCNISKKNTYIEHALALNRASKLESICETLKFTLKNTHTQTPVL